MTEEKQLADAVILLAKKGQRIPDGEVRHCGNCVHNVVTHKSINWHTCLLGGYELRFQRKVANRVGAPCNVQFSGWTRKPEPIKPLSLWQRIFKRTA